MCRLALWAAGLDLTWLSTGFCRINLFPLLGLHDSFCSGSIFAMNSYLIDITTEETRTSRISIFSGIVLTMAPIGNFIAGYLFEYGGHLTCYGVSFICFVLSVLYISLFVVDSRTKLLLPEEIAEKSKNEARSNIFISVWTHLVSCFSVTFKKRTGFKRACITLLILIMCFNVYAESITSSDILNLDLIENVFNIFSSVL